MKKVMVAILIIVVAVIAVVAITMFYRPSGGAATAGQAYFLYKGNNLTYINADYSFVGMDNVTYGLFAIAEDVANCSDSDGGANSLVSSGVSGTVPGQGYIKMGDNCSGSILFEMACGRDLIGKNSKVISQLGYDNASFSNAMVELAVGVGSNIFNKNAPALGKCTGNRVVWSAGLLDVNSSPSKANLYLNGVSQGVVPRQLALKQGVYNVTLKLYGYKDSSTMVGIANGATIKVKANMVPVGGNQTNQTCTAGWVMGSFYCVKNDKYGTWLDTDCSKSKKYTLTCDYGCLNGTCTSNQTQPPVNQTNQTICAGAGLQASMYGGVCCPGLVLMGGICNVNQTQPPVNQTCTDSDGGFNYYVRGTCADANNLTDYCVNSSVVREYLCGSTGCEESHNSPFDCSSVGMACQNGACVNVTQPPVSQTGDLSGTAYNVSYARLPGVNVTVLAVGASMITDANGVYLITGLPVGQYAVNFTKTGYNSAPKTVSIVAGGVASLSAVLNRTI